MTSTTDVEPTCDFEIGNPGPADFEPTLEELDAAIAAVTARIVHAVADLCAAKTQHQALVAARSRRRTDQTTTTFEGAPDGAR